MIIQDILLWWYGVAWFQEIKKISTRFVSVMEAFSVGLLVSTLFSPFRQIDAGGVRGSMEVQFRAWLDRTFSRFFGFFMRSIVIISGCIVAVFVAAVSLLYAMLWLVVPLLPFLGIFMAIKGISL